MHTCLRYRRLLTTSVALLALAAGAQAQLADPELVGPALNGSIGGVDLGHSTDNPPLLLEHTIIGCGKACRARHMADIGWQPGQLLPGMRAVRGPGTVDPTDVLNNNLVIEVAPPTRNIAGSNTMTIRSNVNNLTTFTFRMRSNMNVTGVTVTDPVGSYAVTPPTITGTSNYGRTITFLRPIAQNVVFTIKIDYNGVPASLAFGNFYAGTQNGVAGAPGVIATLSEPYYAGTWWPCKDGDVLQAGDNSDRATLTMSITSPDTFRSTANGVLVGTSVPAAGKITYTYATTSTMPTYLVAFATSVYTNFGATYNYPGGTMPLDFNIYPSSDTTTNRAVWLKIPDMMNALRPVFGEYPFISEKYGIYQFEFSGGMEHQTNSGQGRGGAFNEDVTAHELGHQWWGDWITCKTWNDIWLNEGFASYSEALWAERKPGSTGLPALRSAMNARRPSALTNSVYCTDVTSVNRIFDSNASYRKGGWILHQLRKIVGDTSFVAILQAYRAAFGGSAASTADFTSLASQVAGRNLDWYFNPWLFGIGAPAYEYAWQNTTVNGQRYLKLRVSQTQQGPNPTYPLFTMPIDVRIDSASPSVTRTITHDAQTDWYLLPISAAATAVTLDESDWILNTGKTSVAYAQGPAKIVALSTLPGANLPAASAPTTLSIGFSDNVTVQASDFAVARVVGTGTVAVPFTFAYDPATFIATLTFTSTPLLAGTYNVLVRDSIVNPAAGSGVSALDGEIGAPSTIGLPTPTGAALLPSGDGQPGGNAAFSFTVQPAPCRADFDNSGGVSVDDIFAFLNAWFASAPNADFDSSGTFTVDDIFAFLNVWFAGC